VKVDAFNMIVIKPTFSSELHFPGPQTSDGAILPTHNILELSHSLYGMLFFSF
jgi:hypothetical protein